MLKTVVVIHIFVKTIIDYYFQDFSRIECSKKHIFNILLHNKCLYWHFGSVECILAE